MTREEILQYNKACAMFLGAVDSAGATHFSLLEDEVNLSPDIFDEKLFTNDGGSVWKIKELKFHSDWSWIMYLIEKIESLDYVVRIYLHTCIIQTNEQFAANYSERKALSHSTSKKRAIVTCVNQFLKEYETTH